MRAAAAVTSRAGSFGLGSTPPYTQLQEKLETDSDSRSLATSTPGSFATEVEARPQRGIGSWREQCRVALDDPGTSKGATVLQYIVVFFILISTFCAVLATCRDIRRGYHHLFSVLEEVFTAVFTAEIMLRMWTAVSWKAYLGAWSNIIDIVATLPWYVEAACKSLSSADREHNFSNLADSFRLLRMARLIRIVRLAKVVRHSEIVNLITDSLLASSEGIWVLVAFVSSGTIVAATVVFAAEQDEPDGQFTSLPMSMWWALTTITTVGYGDMVPETTAGRLIGAMTMVGGTLIVTLSVAVVTSSFTEQYRHKTEVAKVRKAFQQAQARQQATHLGVEDEVGLAQFRHRSTMEIIVKRLSHIEEETKSTLALLRNELDMMREMQFRGEGDEQVQRRRSAFGDHATQLFVETLDGQATSFFKAMKHLAESAAIVVTEDENEDLESEQIDGQSAEED